MTNFQDLASQMTDRVVEHEATIDRLKSEIKELKEMLGYWVPQEMPLRDQFDHHSVFHKMKWNTARSLLSKGKQ